MFIVLAGVLPTDAWRWLGVLAAGRMRDDTQAFALVKAIATAMVAGVIAQLILQPSGALAEAPLVLRLSAAIAGFVAMELAGCRGWVGILIGELVLLGGLAVL